MLTALGNKRKEDAFDRVKYFGRTLFQLHTALAM